MQHRSGASVPRCYPTPTSTAYLVDKDYLSCRSSKQVNFCKDMSMFTPRLFIMFMSTAMPFAVLAAPTTELPPAPSAYAYIVVKYPTSPISPPTKTEKTKRTPKTAPPTFSPQVSTTDLPAPLALSSARARSPFSVDRNPTPPTVDK